MSAINTKHHGIFEVFKPRCVKNMENALKRLDFATDRTISLVKENGHALEKAARGSGNERTKDQDHQ